MLAATLPSGPPRRDDPAPARRVEPAPERALTGAASDTVLVERLLAGDPWAQEALYRRYFRPVWQLALRLLAHREDAEDVVQDAFVLALTDARALREPAAFGRWLLRITVRQAHRRFRRRQLHRLLGFASLEEDATLDTLVHSDADPERTAELGRVAQVLRRMPDRQRIVWVLRCVEGYSLEETADLAGASLATVKRDLGAAQAELERRLGGGASR